MSSRFLLSSLIGFALVAGCTTETVTQQGPKKHNSTPAPGVSAPPSEHGVATPGGSAVNPDEGDAVTSGTWADGKKIDAPINIPTGDTVEILAGATVTMGAGAAITIKGTLKVAATTPHSKLTGATWAGLVVAEGGTLLADGLDIEGSDKAITTLAGNADAQFKNGTIKAQTPFAMAAGSKLTVTSVKVTGSAVSPIAGTFIASHMDYDKGVATGLELNDPAGSMTITDSTLRGTGGGDYVVSQNGKLVSLSYATITGTHCALHFDSVGQYTIDHVSFNQESNGPTISYAAMLYGSGAGPNTITSSNIAGIVDMKGTNGPLTIDKSFVGTTATLTNVPAPKNAAADRLADAQPRAQ